jgi:hypothetical protein
MPRRAPSISEVDKIERAQKAMRVDKAPRNGVISRRRRKVLQQSPVIFVRMQHGNGNFQRNNPARTAAIVTRWTSEPPTLRVGQRWCAKNAGVLAFREPICTRRSPPPTESARPGSPWGADSRVRTHPARETRRSPSDARSHHPRTARRHASPISRHALAPRTPRVHQLHGAPADVVIARDAPDSVARLLHWIAVSPGNASLARRQDENPRSVSAGPGTLAPRAFAMRGTAMDRIGGHPHRTAICGYGQRVTRVEPGTPGFTACLTLWF